MRTLPLLLALAACSSPAPDPAPSPTPAAQPLPEPPRPAPTPPPTPRAVATPARAAPPAPTELGGPPIALGDLEGAPTDLLRGELRCAFETEGGTLLLAAADVDPAGRATAIVDNAGVVELLVGRQEGGFNALERGAALGGRGLTADLVRGPEIRTGSEETRHHARLTLYRADGAERTFEGIWTCGP
jgi:hypothetical protein